MWRQRSRSRGVGAVVAVVLLGLLGLLPGIAHGEPRERTEAQDDARVQEARARLAIKPSDAGALVTLGLAAMERGQPDQALAHFDAARQHAPADGSLAPVIAFNRGVCLFELARFGPAETAFASATLLAVPPLSGLAALNAGFAALELGARDRAERHLKRARAADPEGELVALTQELSEELSEGLLDGSKASPVDAVEAPPPRATSDAAIHGAVTGDEADRLLRQGQAAFRAGRFAEARRHMQRARASGPSSVRGRLAQAYLDVLSGGLRAQGRGLQLSSFATAGYDTNVNEIGDSVDGADVGGSSAPASSTYLQLGINASYGAAPGETTFLRVDYGLSQLAYLADAADAFSTQLHQLSVQGEVRPTERLRLGLGGRAGLDLIGRTFDPLSAFGGLDGRVGIQLGRGFETEARAGVTFTRALDGGFGYLDGHRIDVAVAQTWHRPGWFLGAELRFRREQLGSQTITRNLPLTEDAATCERLASLPLTTDTGNPELLETLRACEIPGGIVVPLAYDAPAIEAFVDVSLARWLRLHLRGSIEWRNYGSSTTAAVDSTALALLLLSDATRLQQLASDAAGPIRSQRDLRYSGTAAWLAEPFRDLWLGLSYIAIGGDSNIDGSRATDYANVNFLRHLFEASLSVQWR